MAFLIEFAGRETQIRRSIKAINNWEYSDSFKPKTLLLTDGDHLLTREGPEKVGSFYSETLTLITETGQK